MHKRGGWIVLPNKNQTITTQGFILVRSSWPTSSSQPPRLSSTIPRFYKRVHLEPLQPQVLDGITCNLTTTSFTQGLLATLLTSSPLQPARVQPLQIKDFLTKFSLRTDSVTHLSTINALITRRDLTTKSTRYVDEKITQWVKCSFSFLGSFECLKIFSVSLSSFFQECQR